LNVPEYAWTLERLKGTISVTAQVHQVL